MSNDDKNRRLAQLLGWTNYREAVDRGTKIMPAVMDGPEPGMGCLPVPNYCADLNAVHEATEAWLASLRSDYERREKSYEIESHLKRALKHSLPAFRATEAQRVDALIKTLEKL